MNKLQAAVVVAVCVFLFPLPILWVAFGPRGEAKSQAYLATQMVDLVANTFYIGGEQNNQFIGLKTGDVLVVESRLFPVTPGFLGVKFNPKLSGTRWALEFIGEADRHPTGEGRSEKLAFFYARSAGNVQIDINLVGPKGEDLGQESFHYQIEIAP